MAALAATAIACVALASAGREPAGKWVYYEQPNQAGGTDYYASITSSNHQARLHEAGATMEMVLGRTSTSPADLTFAVSSGNLVCPSFAGCSGTVRFDDGPEEAVTFEGFLESRTDTMFLRDAGPFIDRLESAKRVTISKEMLGLGTQRFRFDVSGLRWER